MHTDRSGNISGQKYHSKGNRKTYYDSRFGVQKLNECGT
jgi:hypothetical protein